MVEVLSELVSDSTRLVQQNLLLIAGVVVVWVLFELIEFFDWYYELDAHKAIGVGAAGAGILVLATNFQIGLLRTAGLPISGVILVFGILVLGFNTRERISQLYENLSGLQQVMIMSIPAWVLVFTDTSIPDSAVIPLSYAFAGTLSLALFVFGLKRRFS